MADTRANTQEAQLAGLYSEMEPHHLFPLWEVLSGLVRPEPTSPAVAWRWPYAEARDYLLRAGDLISAEQAERRVLILENPGMPGSSSITPRLYAGLQLVLSGEIAPCHRHSQSALRFIMEGSGAYTAVDGEKAFMSPFDLILTPNWRWHDHGNPSPDPVVWLDGLDIPTVRAMDAQFAEKLVAPSHEETTAPGSNRTRYGRSMRPVRSLSANLETAREPLFHYPYADWRPSLAGLASSDAPDQWIGHVLEFLNPTTGGAVMPTISAQVRLIPAGFESRARRTTAGEVFTVCEGAGEVEIDGETLSLAERDIVVIPSWARVRWHADRDLVLFVFSDRVIHEKLCLYRETCE